MTSTSGNVGRQKVSWIDVKASRINAITVITRLNRSSRDRGGEIDPKKSVNCAFFSL